MEDEESQACARARLRPPCRPHPLPALLVSSTSKQATSTSSPLFLLGGLRDLVDAPALAQLTAMLLVEPGWP